MILLIAAQLVLLALAFWFLIAWRWPNKVWAGAAIAAATFLIIGVALTGVWVYPPRIALVVVGAGLVWTAWRRLNAPPLAFGWLRRAGGLVLICGFGLGGAALSIEGVTGRLAPRERLDLAPPLRGAGFCAISAGASPLLNFHYKTLAPGFERFRGQSYGVDFISLGPGGFRTRDGSWWSPQPAAPDSYRIFGAVIHAPCAGVVRRATDGLPDQRAGLVDRAHMEGNHVVLQCGAHEVLLAHMKQGSVRVRAGERVSAGDPLGAVGNTGNSDEPHLHISAQTSTDGVGLSGEPVHLTFQGRFLARHSCLRSGA